MISFIMNRINQICFKKTISNYLVLSKPFEVGATFLRCSSNRPAKEYLFSKSPAYSPDASRSNIPVYIPSYYDTWQFQAKRLASVLLSIGVVCIYIYFFRESNDIDELLNAPPHLLASNFQRKYLREQIESEKKAGKNTKTLEAELAYVDVKEAALRSEFMSSSK